MPGVTYERQLQFGRFGPKVLHVITAPRPGGLYTLAPCFRTAPSSASEPVTAIQRRLATNAATTVGINGDFGNAEGVPAGVLVQGGVLNATPYVRPLDHRHRRRRLAARRARGAERHLARHRTAPGLLDQPSPADERGHALHARLGPGDARAGRHRRGRAAGPRADHGGRDVLGRRDRAPRGGRRRPIPPGGGGPRRARQPGAATRGRRRRVATTRDAPPRREPRLVGGRRGARRAGRCSSAAARRSSTRARTSATPALAARSARAAVGQRADGQILLVVVDGGLPGFSVGMTNWELAQAMVRLGAVTAAALEGGDAAALAFDGRAAEPARRRGERPRRSCSGSSTAASTPAAASPRCSRRTATASTRRPALPLPDRAAARR